MAEGKERRFSIEAKAAKRARKLAKKQKQLQQAQADLDQKQQAIDAIKSDVEGQPVTKKRKKDKTVSVDGVQTDKNDAKSNGGLAHEDGQLDASKQQKKRRKKKNKPSNDQDVGEASTEQVRSLCMCTISCVDKNVHGIGRYSPFTSLNICAGQRILDARCALVCSSTGFRLVS